MFRLIKQFRRRMNEFAISVSGRKRLAARQERHMESETQGSETGEVPEGWVEGPPGMPPCCENKKEPNAG